MADLLDRYGDSDSGNSGSDESVAPLKRERPRDLLDRGREAPQSAPQRVRSDQSEQRGQSDQSEKRAQPDLLDRYAEADRPESAREGLEPRYDDEDDYGHWEALKRGAIGTASAGWQMVDTALGRPMRRAGEFLEDRGDEGGLVESAGQRLQDAGETPLRHVQITQDEFERRADPSLSDSFQGVAQAYEDDGLMSAGGQLAREVSDDPAMISRMLVEQTPAMIAGGGPVGRGLSQAARSAGYGSRGAAMAGGGGFGAGQVAAYSPAPNLQESRTRHDDLEDAVADSMHRTAVEAPVTALGTSLAGLRLGSTTPRNLAAQVPIQAGTEGGAVYAGGRTVGAQDPEVDALFSGAMGGAMAPIDALAARYLSDTQGLDGDSARAQIENLRGMDPEALDRVLRDAEREGYPVQEAIERSRGVQERPSAEQRTARQHDLAEALSEDSPVYRRRDVTDVDPEAGRVEMDPDARPVESPERGHQLDTDATAMLRRAREAARRTGAELSRDDLDLAARDIQRDPSLSPEAIVRSYDRRSREAAAREAGFRRHQHDEDAAAAGQPGRDYTPAGRPYRQDEPTPMQLLDAQRDRRGRITDGRPVETVGLVDQDGTPAVRVRDQATGEESIVEPDRISEVPRPDSPRMEQDFQARARRRPRGVGEELYDADPATDRITHPRQPSPWDEPRTVEGDTPAPPPGSEPTRTGPGDIGPARDLGRGAGGPAGRRAPDQLGDALRRLEARPTGAGTAPRQLEQPTGADTTSRLEQPASADAPSRQLEKPAPRDGQQQQLTEPPRTEPPQIGRQQRGQPAAGESRRDPSPGDQARELRRLAEQAESSTVRQNLNRQAEILEQQDAGERPKMSQRERINQMRQVDPAQDDLLTAIRKLGGLATDLETDWRGQFTHLERNRRPGMPAVERPESRGGRSLDDLAESLQQYGYLENRDVHELEEKLFQARDGTPVYSLAGEEQAMIRDYEESMADRESMDESARREPTDDPVVEDALAAYQEYAAEQAARGGEPTEDQPYSDALRSLAEEADTVAPEAVERILEDAARQGTPERDVTRELLRAMRGGADAGERTGATGRAEGTQTQGREAPDQPRTQEAAGAGQPEDLLGPAPVREQQTADAQRAVDDRLSGRGGQEPDEPAPLFDESRGRQTDIEDAAPAQSRARIDEQEVPPVSQQEPRDVLRGLGLPVRQKRQEQAGRARRAQRAIEQIDAGLDGRNKQSLQDTARALGLSPSGNKSEIRSRLTEWRRSNPDEEIAKRAEVARQRRQGELSVQNAWDQGLIHRYPEAFPQERSLLRGEWQQTVREWAEGRGRDPEETAEIQRQMAAIGNPGTHYRRVRQAQEAGLDVPERVRRDYEDLPSADEARSRARQSREQQQAGQRQRISDDRQRAAEQARQWADELAREEGQTERAEAARQAAEAVEAGKQPPQGAPSRMLGKAVEVVQGRSADPRDVSLQTRRERRQRGEQTQVDELPAGLRQKEGLDAGRQQPARGKRSGQNPDTDGRRATDQDTREAANQQLRSGEISPREHAERTGLSEQQMRQAREAGEAAARGEHPYTRIMDEMEAFLRNKESGAGGRGADDRARGRASEAGSRGRQQRQRAGKWRRALDTLQQARENWADPFVSPYRVGEIAPVLRQRFQRRLRDEVTSYIQKAEGRDPAMPFEDVRRSFTNLQQRMADDYQVVAADRAQLSDEQRQTLRQAEDNFSSGSTLYSGLPWGPLSDTLARMWRQAANGGDPDAVKRWLGESKETVERLRQWAQEKRTVRQQRRAERGRPAQERETDPAVHERGSVVRQWGQALVGSSNNEMRVIADRTNSPAVRNLADALMAKAGEFKGQSATYTERSRHRLRERATHIHRDIINYLHRHKLNNEDAHRRIIDLVENPNKPRRGAEGEAARRIERFFQDELQYQRDAGVEIAEAEAYFSRTLDPTKVSTGVRRGGARERQFIDAAQKAYREIGYSQDQAREAAGALLDRVVLGDHDLAPGQQAHGIAGAPAQHTQPRRFTKAAAKHLAEFRDSDIERVLSRYMQSSVKRAEIARTEWDAGDGTRLGFGDRFQNWDKVAQKMREEGVGTAEIEHVRNLVATETGVQSQSVDSRAMKASSLVRTVGAMSLLDRVALSTAPEFFMPALRAVGQGGLRDLAAPLQLFGRHIDAAVRGALSRGTGIDVRNRRLQEFWDLSEDIGIIAGDSMGYIMQARFMGDDLAGGFQQRVSSKFFSGVLLTQLNDYTRVQATHMGHTFMRRQVLNTLNRKGKQANQARAFLRELGVERGREQQFAEWVRRNGFDERAPTSQELRGMSGENARMARMYETALRRFTDQSIMDPHAGTRPRWASHPIGQMIFSLLNFTWAFHENVLNRMPRTMRNLGDEDVDMIQRLGLLPGMVGAGMAAYTAAMVGSEARDLLDEAITESPQTPKTSGFKAERAFSYSGFTGKFDPVLQTLGGLRYQRSVAEGVAGPYVGSGLQAADQLLSPIEGSENTNTAERNFMSAIHQFVLTPMMQTGLAMAPDFGLSGVVRHAAMMVGARGTEEPFVEATAGPEDEQVTQRRMRQGQTGFLERQLDSDAAPDERDIPREYRKDDSGFGGMGDMGGMDGLDEM